MFSRAIASSLVRRIIRRGIGGNGPSLRWRLLYPLSYKKPQLGCALPFLEVAVAFATGEIRCIL
jgi:hypothetical protein